MSFLNRFFGGGTNTNEFTQPIHTYQSIIGKIFGLSNDNGLEQWITQENNEFKIFNTTPEVKLVVKKGASMLSNGKWKAYDFKTGKEIEEHQILDLLKKPNKIQDKNLFLQSVYTSYAIYGNSFVFKNYPFKEGELPRLLNVLQTPQVMLIRSNKYYRQNAINSIIEKYKLVDPNDKRKVLDEFETDEIIHLKNSNPDDPLVGLSVLKTLHMPISNIRAGYGYVNADYTKKGAMGILSPEILKDGGGVMPVNQKGVDDLEKQYSEQTHGTGDRQSKVIISKVPIKYTAISSALKDHQIVEQNDIAFKRIIDMFELDESLFGFQKTSTFNNKLDGEKKAYQNGVIPIANMFSSLINDSLDLVESHGIYVKLEYDHLSCFQEDEVEKSEVLSNKVESMKKLVEMGYTKEEAAEMVELI